MLVSCFEDFMLKNLWKLLGFDSNAWHVFVIHDVWLRDIFYCLIVYATACESFGALLLVLQVLCVNK
jgi:hypothetical protein